MDCLNRMSEEHSLTLERADENENCRSQLDGMFLELESFQRQKIELEDQITQLLEESNSNNIEMKKNQMEKEILLTNNEAYIQEIQTNTDADSKLKNKIKETTENLDNINCQFLTSLAEKEKMMLEREEEYKDLVSSLIALEKSKNDEKLDFEFHINNLVDEMDRMRNENDQMLDDKNEELKKAWTDLLFAENNLHAIEKSQIESEHSEDFMIEELRKELVQAKERIFQLTEECSSMNKECSSKEGKETIEELLTSNGLLIFQISELQQKNHLQSRQTENDNINHKNEIKEIQLNITVKEKTTRDEIENYKTINNELRERIIEIEQEKIDLDAKILSLPAMSINSNFDIKSNLDNLKDENDKNDEISNSVVEDLKFKLNEILNDLIVKTEEADKLMVVIVEKENEVMSLTAALSEESETVKSLNSKFFEKSMGKETEIKNLKETISEKEIALKNLRSSQDIMAAQSVDRDNLNINLFEEAEVLRQENTLLSGKNFFFIIFFLN